MSQHEAGRRTNLGTHLQWEMIPLKSPVPDIPGGDFAYLLKDYQFTVTQRYTGDQRNLKRTFRIAPDERKPVWRLDYLDLAIWVALTPTGYHSPEAAAKDLEEMIRKGTTPWAKEATGGYEPGYRDENSQWENGRVVPHSEDPDTHEEQGSQVPPARTNFGEEIEDGKVVPSIERVADAWEALAAKVAAYKAKS